MHSTMAVVVSFLIEESSQGLSFKLFIFLQCRCYQCWMFFLSLLLTSTNIHQTFVTLYHVAFHRLIIWRRLGVSGWKQYWQCHWLQCIAFPYSHSSLAAKLVSFCSEGSYLTVCTSNCWSQSLLKFNFIFSTVAVPVGWILSRQDIDLPFVHYC